MADQQVPVQQQKPKKKSRDGYGGHDNKEKKSSVFQGVVKELGVFTYRNDRMSAEAFNSSKQSIIDYLNIKNSHAGYALEHNEHFKFDTPAITDVTIRKHVADQVGKAVANYYLSEIPEAYGVLFGQCEPSLRAALEEMEDFETEIHKKRDLLKLWTAITEKCLNPIRNDLGNQINVINRFHAASKKFDEFFQHNRETVAEFYRRFETEVTAAEACGINFVNESIKNALLSERLKENQKKELESFIKNGGQAGSAAAQAAVDAVKLTDDEIEKITNKLKEKALAYEFIKKLNRGVYQDMQVELANRLNDGIDDYPTTILEARRRAEGRIRAINRNNIPIQNSVAFTTTAAENGRNKKRQQGNKRGKAKGCYFCHQDGHFQGDCPLFKEAQEMLKDKMPSKNATKNNGSTKEVVGATISNTEMPNTEMKKEVNLEGVGFCTICSKDEDKTEIHQVFASKRPSVLSNEDILLDNQATVSVFHNKGYLRNIRQADTPLTIVGVGGQITVSQVGDFGTFGKVYYHPDAVANILCFYDVAKAYKVWYDDEEDLFMIQNKKSGKKIPFKNRNKLYIWNPTREIEEKILIQTVDGNMSKYTKHEIHAAQEAKSAFIKFGRPSMKDFEDMVANGKILNCPFTVQDIHRAVDIYGPDLGALKGRTTRKPPEHVKLESYTDRETVEITLTGDIFYIFGIPFLLTKSRNLDLIVVQHLEDGKSAEPIWKGFKSILEVYNKYKFRVSHFLADTEAGLQGLEPRLNELGIIYVPASKNQHVGEIERCIRQVKERCRAFVNTLPYLMTKIIIVHMVYFNVKMINSIPKQSSNQSPREIVTGRKLDYKLDAKIEFGAYAQVNEDNSITNTMDSRTVGGICLGASNDLSASYKFLSLSTWKVITRGSWTVLPLPAEVIDVINQKAMEEDTKGKLKAHPLAKKDKTKNKIPKKQKARNKQAATPISADSSDDDDDWSEYSDDSSPQRFEDYKSTDSSSDYDSDHELQSIVEEATANIHHTVDMAPESRSIDNWYEDISTIFNNFGTVFNVSMQDTEVGLKSLGSKTYANFLRRRNEDEIDDELVEMVMTQLSVKAGIKQWGAKAIVAAMEELRQLIMKDVFIFVERNSLTRKQQQSILRTLLFLKEKRDGRLKGRCCVDGRPQAFMEQSIDPFSPTVSIETFFTSALIDSYEDREVATADIEGAYLIVDMFDEEVFVDLDPVLSAIVVAMFPHLARFLDESGRLTARLGKALYGCIQSARMFYEHLKSSLLSFGFAPNPYEPCIFNKIDEKSGKQITVTVYVDDVKISCQDPSAVNDVLEYLRSVYRTISVKRGQHLEYLGINLDYSKKGEVSIDMKGMVSDITSEIPEEAKAATPADTNLFKIRSEAEPASPEEARYFHSMVAKLLYIAKRVKIEILTAVSFLTTRVKDPSVDDMKKLARVLRYLKGTKDLKLTLRCHDISQLICYVDAAHYVHVDGKGHSGVLFTMGEGAFYNSSRKQRLVAKSSTEAELIAISDGLSQAIWLRNLLGAQGYDMKPIILYQDNMSTITLIKKGKSTSERTRHVDLRYFFIADRVKNNEVVVKYMPTKEMLADLHTKPLQGALFREMRGKVMNATTGSELQGCVEKTRFSEHG